MTALEIARKAEHEIVNAVAGYMLCERHVHNELCNKTTHRIVEAVRQMVKEIRALQDKEIEAGR